MSEPSVFRPIERGNYRVSPFVTHKRWYVSNTNYSASGYSLQFAKHSAELNPITSNVKLLADFQNYGKAGFVVDDIGQSQISRPTNDDGTFQGIIWQSLNHKYYKFPYDPARSLDVPDRNSVEKFLFLSASSLTIPYMKVGERVKAGTLQVTCSSTSFTLYDDGKGNLRDRLINSQSFATASNLVGYWGFNDQYRAFRHHYKDYMHVKTGSMEFASNTFEPDIGSEIRNIRFNSGIPVTGEADPAGTVAATAEFEFKTTTSTSSGKTITIISADGTSKTYQTTAASDATGTVLGNGNTAVQLYQGTPNQKAIQFAAAINHANGHAGKITATVDGGTVTLTQDVLGISGNTSITYGDVSGTGTFESNYLATTPPNAFTGGVGGGPDASGSGLQADFDGQSFIKTDAYKPLNFDKEDDYAISFWYRGGVSQSVYSGSTSINNRKNNNLVNSLISKRGVSDFIRYNRKKNIREVREENDFKRKYPFDLSVFNHAAGVADVGKIRFKVSDGIQTFTSQSATQCTGSYFHILAQKSGSFFELYINGVREFRASSSLVRGEVKNKSKLMFGSLDTTCHRALSGSLDEIRIYEKGLPQTAISSLANNHYISGSAYQTSVAGNIFYKYGQIVISSNMPRYHNAFSGTWNIDYKGTHTIFENEVLVEVPKGHCNVSMNPTALVRKNTDRLKPAFTGSLRPYITSIGLYNDDAQLVAVAKLAQPIQKRDDVDMNFIVRWDY